jgi:hypothetical protein
MQRANLVVLAAILMVVGTATAQVNANRTGHFLIELMGVFAKADLKVDIDLEGAMLQVLQAQ